MSLVRIPDHFNQALIKLIPPFWGKPVIAALLCSYIRRVQEFEDDCIEVAGAFDVNTCDEARLNVLGRVVGQANFGWSLETYRSVVRARIATNRSHGREDDIVGVLRLITGAAPEVVVTHMTPATVLVAILLSITEDQYEAIKFLMPKTRSAGVKMLLTAQVGTTGFLIDSSAAPFLSGAGTEIDSSVTPDADAGHIGSAIVL